MKKLILILTMACFATFISAQNNQPAPPDKPKTEKEAEKGAEKKTPESEAPAPGTSNEQPDNTQKLSDGTKKATIVKTMVKKILPKIQ